MPLRIADTSAGPIKDPLLVLLHDMGWRPTRKPLFARLFSN